MNYRPLTGEEIRRVACPLCGAPPGSPCTIPEIGGPRDRHHVQRVAAARAAGSQQGPAKRALDAKRRRVADKWLRP